MKIVLCMAFYLGFFSWFIFGTEDISAPMIEILEFNKSNNEDFACTIQSIGTTQTTHIKSTLGTLSHMPDLIRFTALHTIDVSCNKLTSLRWINQIPFLVHLKASNNKIVSVEPLRKKSLLEKIKIDWNELTDITPILPIIESAQLKKLSVYGNPLNLDSLERNIEILKEKRMTPQLAKIIYKLLLCNHSCAVQKMKKECKNYIKVLFSANFDEEDQKKLLSINEEAKKFKELSLTK